LSAMVARWFDAALSSCFVETGPALTDDRLALQACCGRKSCASALSERVMTPLLICDCPTWRVVVR
jgi:hypothetical protein